MPRLKDHWATHCGVLNPTHACQVNTCAWRIPTPLTAKKTRVRCLSGWLSLSDSRWKENLHNKRLQRAISSLSIDRTMGFGCRSSCSYRFLLLNSLQVRNRIHLHLFFTSLSCFFFNYTAVLAFRSQQLSIISQILLHIMFSASISFDSRLSWWNSIQIASDLSLIFT